MDRFYLLAPAALLLATFCLTFAVYCGLCVIGKAPVMENVKHNQLFGFFFARFLVWFISPLERLLIGRVTPNMITATSLLMCGIAGVAAALGHLAGAVWLYVAAGILDVLDGRLARNSGQQTPAGALFDSVSDRWGELFVFAGYAWYLHTSPWLLAVMAAMAGSTMVSYTRARAEGLGISLAGGVMQRAERIVLVAGGTLVAAWYSADVDTASLAPGIVGVTMLICGVAATATALNRWVMGYRALQRRAAQGTAQPELTPVVPAIPAAQAVASVPAQAPARVLLPQHVRKVAPLEQH